MENSQTIDLERAWDTSQPAQSRLPEGVAPTFPTSLTGVAKTAGSTAPMTPTIDYSAMETQPIDTTPLEDFRDQYQSSQDIMGTIQGLSTTLTPAEREGDVLAERISSLTREIGGQEGEAARLEEEVGISDLEQRRADVLNQIRIKQASLTAGLVSEEGRVVPMGVITGRQAQLRRQAAAELEGLAAVADALSNNITTAQSRVDRAVRMKYEPLKAELDAQQQMLGRLDTKAAQQRATELDLQKLQLDRALSFEQTAMNSIIGAMQNGFDSRRGSALMTALNNGQISPSQVLGETSKYQASLIGGGEVVDETGLPSPYSVERANRTIEQVDRLMEDVDGWTVGWGSWLRGIPTTKSRDFNAELQTLKSNIAFNELTQMREASKTGGALGQVSDREGRLLESALGALDSGQSPENFKQNLTRIKESIQRWQEAQGVYGTSTENVVIAPDGTRIIITD